MEFDIKKIFYQEAIDIWQKLCVLHKNLYEQTCEEYLALLSGDVDQIEKILQKKQQSVAEVSMIEKQRKVMVDKLNEHISADRKIQKAIHLIDFFTDIDAQIDIPVLKNLNALLIDMIEKIQAQNKKNQVFLNKAMFSLKELKEEFKGQKHYVTYGADGLASRITAR